MHYVYGLGPAGLQAVSLSVLMLPSATFVPPPAQPPASAWTEDALLDALSAQIEAWFAELAPSAGSALTFDQASGSWLSTAGPSGGGLLVLDLVVMASATAMPLLELANLTLPISSVSPALKTC